MSDQPPPMEEILASIRKIIADDRPIAPPQPLTPEGDDEEDVLELGEAPDETAPAEVIPAYFPPPPAPPATPVATSAPLMSGEATAASRKALAALSNLKLDPDAPPDTVDGLVREMLRPMLKEWLDANLPELVERVVAREVARLGGR